MDLVVTSPPFLDVVDYAGDNWLRCWFCGIDPQDVPITIAKRPADWQAAMRGVFDELYRVVRSGGFVAFEVGEVRGGKLRLEDLVLPAALGAGFEACLVVVNAQKFTKTANCWGVTNNQKGTNSNRIVVVRSRTGRMQVDASKGEGSQRSSSLRKRSLILVFNSHPCEREKGSGLNGAKISHFWDGFDGAGRASDGGVLSGGDSFLGDVFWRVVRYERGGREDDRRR